MREAIAAASGRDVSRETFARLQEFADLVIAEADIQNLVARSTLPSLWERHIIDSAQLLRLVGPGRCWADIGSGAGFPGMVTAILSSDAVSLIEPRKLRADFLRRAATALGLGNVTVVEAKSQSVAGRFDVITARAVAPAVDLLGMTSHLAHRKTRFLLMKGRSAKKELEDARRAWQGCFELVASCTDPEAAIIVAEAVVRRGGRA